MLNGKAKADFEKWYALNQGIAENMHFEELKNQIARKFYRQHPSMKFGMYVEWFDSVGIEIDITPNHLYFEYLVAWSDSDFKQGRTLTKDRIKVRELALIDADIIYNELNS